MIPKMMYCKSGNFQWCFIFGNFGADNFYRKKCTELFRYYLVVLAPLPGKRVLPKISLHRIADFGEFRKYYTTENFCFYSTQIGSMEILHDLWFMQLVIADLTHWPQAWVSQAMLYASMYVSHLPLRQLGQLSLAAQG